MKSLTLTEIQKKQLLEMCNTLFPEYSLKNKFEFIENQNGDESLNIACRKRINQRADGYEYYTEIIHWFEFCFTHLANKIDKNNGFSFLYDWESFLVESWKNEHPIDFLYKKFKNL